MKKHIVTLSLLCMLTLSCCAKEMILLVPGNYCFEKGDEENSFSVTSESYFVACLTEYSIRKGEADSFKKRHKKTGEKGHWYVPGDEYLLDLSWKNCDFETMPSFYQYGCDDNIVLLWSEEMKNIDIHFLGMRKGNSLLSAEIRCYDSDAKKGFYFRFTQSIEE
ncbi:MAG: hypothetical protein IKQ78_02370 [Bacilli bacterium]|nr:hypothetical protein [Bacilli bacterium]